MTEPHGIDFPYQLEKIRDENLIASAALSVMDVTVLTIVKDKVIARITTSEDFAEKFCVTIVDDATDYIVVSKGDDILWIVDGMSPGWYIPENTKAALDRYPELKGKF